MFASLPPRQAAESTQEQQRAMTPPAIPEDLLCAVPWAQSRSRVTWRERSVHQRVREGREQQNWGPGGAACLEEEGPTHVLEPRGKMTEMKKDRQNGT